MDVVQNASKELLQAVTWHEGAATSVQFSAHRVLRALLRISLEGRVQPVPVHQLDKKCL